MDKEKKWLDQNINVRDDKARRVGKNFQTIREHELYKNHRKEENYLSHIYFLISVPVLARLTPPWHHQLRFRAPS